MPSLSNDDLKTYHRLRTIIEDALTKTLPRSTCETWSRLLLDSFAAAGVSFTLPPERQLLDRELED